MDIEMIRQANNKEVSPGKNRKSRKEPVRQETPIQLEKPLDPKHLEKLQLELKEQTQKKQINQKKMTELLENLQNEVRQYDKRFNFSFNEEIDRVIVKVVDRNTEKIIKEIPPAEIQHVLANIRKALGLFFDQEI